MEKFNELFADALEIELGAFNDETELHSLDEWDSMAALSVIAFAAQIYGKNISGDQLEMCNTVKDVRELII